MPKNNRVELNRSCYTLAVVNDKHAELTMYGDIVEARPVDWWTGEEVKGDFIIQGEFLADLETVKGCDDLTIHLNSCGGDAYVAIAIHNRLKELARDGMDITCIVDGAAMSGGSLIMCAADHVKVNPSSLILIHDCWAWDYGRFNSTKLRQLADQLDTINESQAEIYVAKSGMEHDEVRSLMQKETMVTGRKAVDMGLADELIEDAEDPEIEASADHRILFVKGRQMRVAAMGQLPEGIRTHIEEIAPGTGNGDGGDKNQAEPDASANTQGGVSMTLEEFRKENPEAAEALMAEAQAQVNADTEAAVTTAVAAERQRIAEIDGIASLYNAETVNAAKYTDPCTAQELAFRAAQEQVKTGAAFLTQMKAGYQGDGAGAVPAVPMSEEDEKPMTAEDRRAAGKAMSEKLSGKNTEEV